MSQEQFTITSCLNNSRVSRISGVYRLLDRNIEHGNNYNRQHGNSHRLVVKAQKGDLQAFEALVQMYQLKIYNLALHLSGNPSDAQDVAQEAFIRAYRSLGSFRNESDFGTWLHRITVNCWHNHRKKNQKVVTFSIDEPVESDHGAVMKEIAAADADPLEAAEERELREEIYTALKNLSPDHRTALVLRELQGYTYEEIAGILNCSLGTVKSRINRARANMRDLLGGSYFKRGG